MPNILAILNKVGGAFKFLSFQKRAVSSCQFQNIPYSDQRYVGINSNVAKRLNANNEGRSQRTSKFKQWKLIINALGYDQFIILKIKGKVSKNKRSEAVEGHF